MIATGHSTSNDRYLNADLHCHSLASDGQLSPSDLVDRAVERGVQMLALTDHDTLAGLDEAHHAAEGRLQMINGIELSSRWRKIGVHIVGLDFNPQGLSEAVAQQHQARKERAEVIGKRLSRKGMAGALAGATEIADGAEISRVHFAQFLVQQGHVKTETEAFKKWLGTGKIGDVKANWPEMDTVVRWIVDAGGIAVLAHPHHYNLTHTKLRELVADFQSASGKAMEIAGCGINPNQRQNLVRLCQETSLWGSRGSDFHRPNAWTDLGKGPALPDGIEPVWQYFKQQEVHQ